MPIIAPGRQTAFINYETSFICNKPPSAEEPDRYQWFKLEKGNQNNDRIDYSNSIGNGELLEITNITEASAGWYICCMLYSTLDSQENIANNNNNNADYLSQNVFILT
jgi:hypothetical protein